MNIVDEKSVLALGRMSNMKMGDGKILSEKMEKAVAVGEVPYRANRRALRSFDIVEDVDKGIVEAETTVVGLDSFIDALEDLKNAAEDVSRKSIAAIR